MFNATALRVQARHPTRLDSYFTRNGFKAIVHGLIKDGVPEDQIMQTVPGECTMLHDVFYVDFCSWIGGEFYYNTLKNL